MSYLTYVLHLIVCDMMFFLFFCFKQKTAYEMRISDWSSDVCSSDLRSRCRRLSIVGRRRRWRDGRLCLPPARYIEHNPYRYRDAGVRSERRAADRSLFLRRRGGRALFPRPAQPVRRERELATDRSRRGICTWPRSL